MRLSKRIVILFLLLFSIMVKGQFLDKKYYLVDSLDPKNISDRDRALLDSLLKQYNSTDNDTLKINDLSDLIEECYDEKIWIKYNMIMLRKCVEGKKNAKGMVLYLYRSKESIAYNNIGYYVENYKGLIDSAFICYKIAYNIQVEINDKKRQCTSLSNMAHIYDSRGDVYRALEIYNKILQIQEKIPNDRYTNPVLSNMAGVLLKMHDTLKAMECLKKSYKLGADFNNKSMMGRSLFSMGRIYLLQHKLKLAKECINSSLELRQELGDKASISVSYGLLGNLYILEGRKELALEYFNKSLSLSREIGYKYQESSASNFLGTYYSTEGNLKEAKIHFVNALRIGRELGFPELVKEAAKNLSNLFAAENDYKQAMEMKLLYSQLSDSLRNIDLIKKLNQEKYRSEFNEKENKLREEQLIQNKQALAEKKQQLIIIYAVSFSLLIVLFLVAIIFRSLKQNKLKNIIISEQKKVVDEKNKDITDSINYAKKIQEALLPPKELKYELFPNAFVLFQPRDIVSGDFYWFAAKNGKRIIGAVDCTGHGVPGAFMSMIGNTFLNEIIMEKGVTEPAAILSDLRHMVIKSLKQDGINAESKDGMDMALIAIDEKQNILEFAGANNPMWLIRDGQCIEYTADKRPIGFFRGKGLPFTNHKIELQKGDSIYIFTDGYADQFGGPKGKKFKYKQFQEILLSIQDEPMLKQEEILLKKFADWKGTLDQVDDVLIIGIKV